MGEKCIELMNEIAPRVSRVAAMFNPASTFAERFFQSAEAAGQKLRVEVLAARVNDPEEIDAVMAMLAREPGAGLIFPPYGFTTTYRRHIAELVTRYHLPAIDRNRPFATEGGLASYGPDARDAFRAAASYLDRLLLARGPPICVCRAPLSSSL